jgi:hypothetical protein
MSGMGNHMTVVDNHMTVVDNHTIVVEQGRSASLDGPDGGLLCFLFAFLAENTAFTS